MLKMQQVSRRAIVFSCAAVVVAFALLAPIIGTYGQRAKIVATPAGPRPTYLLGEVRSGAARCEAAYELKNLSWTRGKIRFLGTSCGCTGVYLNGRKLLQREEIDIAPRGSVRVAIHSSSPGTAGLFSYQVGFENLTEGREPVTIVWDFSVVREVTLSTTVIAEAIPSDGKFEKSVRVERYLREKNATGHPPIFQGYRPTDNLDGFQLRDRTKVYGGISKEVWEGRVSINTDGVSDRFKDQASEFLIGFPDLPQESWNKLFVRLTRAMGVRSPDHVSFGRLEVGQRRNRKIVLQALDGLDFKVVGIGALESGFRVTHSGTDAKTVQLLDIEMSADQVGSYRENVVIEIDHPQSREIKIVLEGECVEKKEVGESG